jgi:hypothetical protein
MAEAADQPACLRDRQSRPAAALMTAVHDQSLGQVTRVLYEVDRQYRRNM